MSAEQKVLKLFNIHKHNRVPQVVAKLAKVLKCELDVCNFIRTSAKKGSSFQCFVRITGDISLQEALDKIKTETKFQASIPTYIPPLQQPSKKGKLKLKTRLALRIPDKQLPVEVLKTTQRELMKELQLKYTGLYNLSRKTGHLLLEDISRTLYERLKSIMDRDPDKTKTCYLLSQAYRKFHPHFGDFHLILGILHKVEDAAGHARTQLSDQDLIGKPKLPLVMNNMPFETVKQACNRYADRINKKILVHIKGLDSEPNATDSQEDIDRKKVREQLKSMTQFIPMMVKQVIAKQFIPQKAPYHRITVYGEPFLQSMMLLAPLWKRHHAVKVRRSDRICNMVRFNVPNEMISKLFEYDGRVLNDSKLIIRSSDAPLYKPTKEFGQEMKALYGVEDIDKDIVDYDEPIDGDGGDDCDYEDDKKFDMDQFTIDY